MYNFIASSDGDLFAENTRHIYNFVRMNAKVGDCISGGFGILAQAAKLPTTVLTTGARPNIGSFREAKTGGHNKHFGALEEASNGPCQAELSRP